MRKLAVAIFGLLVVGGAVYGIVRVARHAPSALSGSSPSGSPPSEASSSTPSPPPTTTAQSSAVPGTPQPDTNAGAAGDVSTTASAPPAQPVPAAQVHWWNIADRALGGRIERVTSVSDERDWLGEYLNDGGVGDFVCAPFCSWAAKDTTFPQDIVLSFHQRRQAVVRRVVLDTLTPVTRTVSEGLPRQVEIAVSTTSTTDGFTRVATVELPPEWDERIVDVPPTPARYLRVRIASGHGTSRVVLGEIKVFEAEEAPSILADFPHNLALPALGGAIVSFTSDYATYTVARLIDGDPADEWRSSDAYLPQEFVFAFRDDAPAFVDRIVLTTKNNLTTAARVVTVSTSLASPVAGFEDVGAFTLKQVATDQSFSIGRQARFVKLRILENFGSPISTSLGEVQLIEGAPSGYESVLVRHAVDEPTRSETRPSDTVDDASAPLEQEKNDEIAQANRLALGGAFRGVISPIGENDYFKVSVPGPQRSMLTMDLSGRPNIRTSLSLVTASGATVNRFDPAHVPAERATFSWLVDPGEYAIQVTQPRSSVVLIWDTSGSMERNVKDLQRAVDTYLDQVSATELVNLIRFSYDIEVLLPDFTSDRVRLKKAAEGKFFADGHTPFYDVMAKATNLLEGRPGNRAIVVMTDGEDAGSDMSRSDFWRQLETKGIRVYTIGIGDAGRYSVKLGSTPRRLLKHAAMATNGRAFFAEKSADLVTAYKQISDELRAQCAYRLKISRANATGTLEVRATGERITTVAAPAQMELILDASGSMKRAIAGRTMIETAKNVLSDIVRGLPDHLHVALRVYGHRIREREPGACQDSELVFPFAKLNKAQLLAKIRSVQALGTTPIAYSLQQVASDMEPAGDKMVILVTDGKEECGGDPAATVKQLVSGGIKLKLNIVGFGLADASLKAELRKLAELTAGQFVDAKDASSLRSAIEQSFALPYEVLEAAGKKVAAGTTGQAGIQLPEGVYTVRVKAEPPIEIARVRIGAQQATTIELKKEGREIGMNVGPPGR
jgi:VWFA-related protein